MESKPKRTEATREEAEILLQAQGDYIKMGTTHIRCPRCGGFLEYRCGVSYEKTCCLDESCISVVVRGL